ncbi:MAG: DNA-binding protein WhiA [Candidatus Limnocylindrales bacterium]
MSRAERDLVSALRAELAAADTPRPCDRRALAAGLGPTGADRDAVTARLAVRLGLGGRAAATPSASFDWPTARDHCRVAFLRGLFLGHGSLSLASGTTHLEFVLDPDEASTLAGQVRDLDMPASSRVRRGRGVVTWKSSETVIHFLRMAGAGAALLELEARQVSRAVRGDLNRVINAESANLNRAVEAAGRQLAAIAELQGDGRLAHQPHVVRLVAEARRETPEATFAELAERLELHRSTVQRALERVEWLATHDVDPRGLGPPDVDRRPHRARRDRAAGAAASA